MDLQGNKVTATMYDANITALSDQLTLGKTYIISNAMVKNNISEFKSTSEEKIWTITGRTKVEELNENNLNFLFSKYELTPFHALEHHMDKNTNINIIGVAIETVMLTLWDTFVERECTAIVQNLPTKLVIWAINLKASSFNGITLSTKANSNIFINAELLAVTDYKEWVLTNKEKLDQLIERKPFVPISPPKLSPPADNKYTSIALLLGLYLGRKFYWIKAHWKIITMQQRFWYMSCSNCKKTSTADLGQIHKCRFCKYEHAKAEPRANAFVRFEDKTGQLDASIIGKATEALLETNANVIMEHYQQNPNTVLNNLTQTSSEIELLFYLKAIQKKKIHLSIVMKLSLSSTL